MSTGGTSATRIIATLLAATAFAAGCSQAAQMDPDDAYAKLDEDIRAVTSVIVPRHTPLFDDPDHHLPCGGPFARTAHE